MTVVTYHDTANIMNCRGVETSSLLDGGVVSMTGVIFQELSQYQEL